MSRRRAGNNAIRGPQSALTDFLASHNISAVQIRSDYERRQAAAAAEVGADDEGNDDGANADEQAARALQEIENEKESKKRKRKSDAAIEKIKKSKEFQKRKRSLKGEPGEDDDDGLAFDMYKKSKPLPGQLENCAQCEKRFTVTPYSKEDADGQLLCAKCSKEVEASRQKEAKQKKRVVAGDKRRKIQSDLLDGSASLGSKSLIDLCVKKVAEHIEDVEEFGDLPPDLLDRLSQILSKRRVLDPKTLDLFLRPEVDRLAIYDCAKLKPDDYNRMFSVIPTVQKLDLRNAGQIKDVVIDYMIDRDLPLRDLRLDAPNLVTETKWIEFFEKIGHKLESLQLSWLQTGMDDDTVEQLANHCQNLRLLKLKHTFNTGDLSLQHISRLKDLERLSLAFSSAAEHESLGAVVQTLGPQLRQLSLHRFHDADDDLLATMHASCARLEKLCLCETDGCTDAGFAALFDGWANPPLRAANLSRTRSLDAAAAPEGPADAAVGFASAGLRALLAHSGQRLERLNVSSCRHIGRDALLEVFDGKQRYPALRDVDLSFVTAVDTTVVAGLFRSCPTLHKVAAFGCFDVRDIVVPPGVALIGVPTAQDSIVQTGDLMQD